MLQRLSYASRLMVCAAAMLSFLQFAAPRAEAAPIFKADNTTNLDLGGSWVGGVAPSAGDVATWNATVTGANSVALGANLSWQGIQVANPGGAVTITPGNTLILGTGGINMSTATQDLTLQSNVNLSAAQTWNVASGRTLRVEGAIGQGGHILSKEGTGTLIFSGAGSTSGGEIRHGWNTAGGTLQFASGASYASTNRLATAVGGGGSGTVTLDAGVGTVSFGGNQGSSGNYIGVDGGTGTLNVNGGTLNFTGMPGGAGHLFIGANGGVSNGVVNIHGGAVTVGTRVMLGTNYTNNTLGTGGWINANGNATLTLSSGSLTIGTADAGVTDNDKGWLYLKGPNGGTGTATVNLDGGTLALVQFGLGTGGTSKEINLNGGTLQARASTVNFLDASNATVRVKTGGAKVDTNGNNITIAAALLHDAALGATLDGGLTKTGAGTLTLSGANTYTGATNVNGGTLHLAATGSLSSAGHVNTTAGGVFTISGALTMAPNTYFATGNGLAGTTGTITVESGAVVNLGGNAVLIGGNRPGGAGSGVGTLTLNGGLVTVAAASGTGGGADTARIWLNPYGTTATSVLNLNGGVLSTARAIQDGGGNNSLVNFNGGTLQAAASIDLMNNVTNAVIQAGGLIVDTQNFNATISKNLSHAAALGATPDGGLIKTGAGTLTLTNNTSDFTGNLVVQQGTLIAQAGGGGVTSSLGRANLARSVTVNNGATLSFNSHDVFGNAGVVPLVTLVVDEGGLVTNNNTFTTLGPVTLSGGSITAVGGANGTFRSFALRGNVTVNGATTSTLAASGGNGQHGFHLGGVSGVDFNVADGAAAIDLLVSGDIHSAAGGQGNSSLSKSGLGTMVLTGNNTYTGTTTINAGLFRMDGTHTNAGAYTVNGGALGGSGSISTNNASVTIAAGGQLSPGASVGTLTMSLGGGTLDLSGISTGGLLFELDTVASSDLVTLNSGTLNVGTLDFDEFVFSTLAGFGAGVYTLFDANSSILGSIGVSTGLLNGGTHYGVLSIDGANNNLLLTATAVPEPSSLIVWSVLGLSTVLIGRRLRRRK